MPGHRINALFPGLIRQHTKNQPGKKADKGKEHKAHGNVKDGMGIGDLSCRSRAKDCADGADQVGNLRNPEKKEQHAADVEEDMGKCYPNKPTVSINQEMV